MKCAEAKTWLSLVTATVNSLRAAIGFPFPPPPPPPAALEQDDVDRGAREVGGGARVARVALVPQLAIERGDGRPSRGRAHAPCVDHTTRPALHSNCFLGAQLARDMGVGPRSDPPSGGTRRAARASGASSSTRPRLVLDGAQRAVASTAARIVAPSGRSPAAANAGPIATALARKSA